MARRKVFLEKRRRVDPHGVDFWYRKNRLHAKETKMARKEFSNETCSASDFTGTVRTPEYTPCEEPAWTLPSGVRVNTPFCQKHSKAWGDARMTDPEQMAY
jgi:hypothetical protein